MCAFIPTRDKDTGETRILKAGKINENRKLQFPEPVKRSLFEPETAMGDRKLFWHVLDIPSSDRPAMPIISKDRIAGEHVKDTWELSGLLDGLYIRPPDNIVEQVAGSFEKGEQTVAAFIAEVLRYDEDEIRDAYDPDHSFFPSEQAYHDALDEQIPRYVFYASHEYKEDERRVDYYFLMSQESFSYSSRETRELMLVHGNILSDDRLFAVLDELDRSGGFSPSINLFE